MTTTATCSRTADEADLKLDPCLADTDGDSVEDGYEYQAAVDLNHYTGTQPLPYPGKRPYPNPLDPADGTPSGTDYDDDGLLLREEFLLAALLGRRQSAAPPTRSRSSGLLYSDGLQRSAVVSSPVEPLARAGPSTSTATPCSPTTSAMPTRTDWATGTKSAAG